MNHRKLFIVGGLFALTSVSQADNSGWSSITELKVWDDQVDIRLDNPHTCGQYTSIYILDNNSGEYREKYAALLSAYTLAHLVNVQFTCAGGDAKIEGVRIKP